MSTPSADELAALTRRFALERHRYLTLLSRSIDLGRSEFDALDYVQEAGALTPKELADRLCITSGATTALIDRLEKAGMLTRSPHPTDRRSLLLRLSKGSEKSAAKTLSPYTRDVMAASRDLTDEERATVAKYLERLIESLVSENNRLE